MKRIESALRRNPRLSLEVAGIGISIAVADCALATIIKDPAQALAAVGAFTGATIGSAAALILKSRAERRRKQYQDTVLDEDVAVLTLCQDGHILAMNAAAARIAGYGTVELVGQPLSRLFDDGDIQAGRPNHILKAASIGGTFEDTQTLVRQNGAQFQASVTATARGSGFVFTIAPCRASAGALHRDRRADDRMPTEEEVRLRVLGGSTLQRHGRLVDVSERGLGIELGQVITEGASVVVEWKCGFLLGTVRNCRRSPNGWEIGVELESVPARHPMTVRLKKAAEERFTRDGAA